MDDLIRRWPGFLAAVRTADLGSFSEAARQMNMTSAAVGKSVAALEKHLGVRLFNRTTRQLSLTKEGEHVVECARQAMAALNEAGALASRDGQAITGLVRITCAVAFGRRYLMPAVARVMERYPGLRIELYLTDRPIDLVREGFDIGVRGGIEPPQGMVAQAFCTITTRLVASTRYLLRHGDPGDWSQLADHRLIGVRLASGRVLEWRFQAAGGAHTLSPKAHLMVSSPEAVVEAALLDIGIAQVGLHHAWEELERGRLKTVLTHQHVPVSLPMTLYYPHRKGLAPRVRRVVDVLMQCLNDDAGLNWNDGGLIPVAPASTTVARQRRPKGS